MEEIFVLKEKAGAIKTASDIFKQIDKIDINFKQENFILICLDTKNNIIHKEVLFRGGLNSCTIDNKTIFRTALYYNSKSIIIAHNHPSSDLKPSSEDYDGYNAIKKAGQIISIICLDSIIFNKTQFYSMNKEE